MLEAWQESIRKCQYILELCGNLPSSSEFTKDTVQRINSMLDYVDKTRNVTAKFKLALDAIEKDVQKALQLSHGGKI